MTTLLLSHFFLNLRKTADDPDGSGTGNSLNMSDLNFANILGEMGSELAGYSNPTEGREQQDEEVWEEGEHLELEEGCVGTGSVSPQTAQV